MKGMPPGVYSENDNTYRRFGNAHVALVLTAVALVAFAGFKAVKNRRAR